MKAVCRLLPYGALWRFTGALVLALNSAHAVVAEVCPSAFPVQPPPLAAEQQRALDALSGLDEVCSTRPDYFAWQGSLWLTLHHPQKAANALEKALLLNPDLAGAQLDYAQALAELGEAHSARQLVETVIERPDIPPALHDWLSSRMGQLGGSAWQGTWMVQALLGAESNLNSAPATNFLILTLPGGNVPVLLGASERPSAGMANLDTVAGEASRPLGPGRLTVTGEATVRASPGNTSNNLQWMDGAVTWGQPVLGGEVAVRAAATRLWMGGAELYDENDLRLFMERPLPWREDSCRYGLGGEYSARSYPVSPALDGRYRGGLLGLSCQQDTTRISAIGQWGVDQAQDPQRLGGDQQRDDFFLMASHPLSLGLVILSGQWSRLQDQEAYSSLLGGVPRQILRRSGRLQYEHPISGALTALGYFEKTSQNSNIDLFGLENRALYLGLRWGGK